MSTSTVFLILSGPIMAVGLFWYRSDYRRYGQTTPLGVTALLLAWFMPMCVLGFAIPFFPAPTRPLQYLGYGLMLLGLFLLLIPLHRFSTPKMLGQEVEGLITEGIYRYSRNPQYVAWFLFILGYAMTGRSAMAYLGVTLWVVLAHLTVLVEEEHLDRLFGEEYRRYRARTSRYFPVPGGHRPVSTGSRAASGSRDEGPGPDS